MTAASTAPVLVFDDSPALAANLQQQLRDCGVAARCTADVDELLRGAAGAVLVFIELYLPLCLPRDNGFRLCRQLRNLHPRCAVVLLSGTGRATDLPWALGAGALAVLARPFTVDQLKPVLAQAGLLAAVVDRNPR